MLKRIFALIIAFACVFSITVSAQSQEENSYDLLSYDIKMQLSETEYNNLSPWLQESISKYGIPNLEEIERMENGGGISLRAASDYGFIPSATAFERYTYGSFIQQVNVCLPLAVANAISYFDYIGRTNLIAGTSLSQNEFTEICNKTQWGTSGTTLPKAVNGLALYVGQRGYVATDKLYYISYWTNSKNSINNGYPLLVEQPTTDPKTSHYNLAIGYKVENNEKLLLVCTGDYDVPLAWLNINLVTKIDRIWVE